MPALSSAADQIIGKVVEVHRNTTECYVAIENKHNDFLNKELVRILPDKGHYAAICAEAVRAYYLGETVKAEIFYPGDNTQQIVNISVGGGI
jgi:predicted nuclease with RNAse H fold